MTFNILVPPEYHFYCKLMQLNRKPHVDSVLMDRTVTVGDARVRSDVIRTIVKTGSM